MAGSGAVDLKDLIKDVVGDSDTSTDIKVASGSAATAKGGSGFRR